jgi:hypothetical protein
VLGSIGPEIGIRLAGERSAAAAPTLIEQHNVVDGWIEESPLTGTATGTRSSVEKEGGLAFRISAALPVDMMPVPDVEQTAVIRFTRGILRCHVYSLADTAVKLCSRHRHSVI